MTEPRVLNKRTDKIPPDAIYVGRPSKWGNPFKISKNNTREQVIVLYEVYARTAIALNSHWLDGLNGKDLVCWCSPLPCHADILLELANEVS